MYTFVYILALGAKFPGGADRSLGTARRQPAGSGAVLPRSA